MLPPPEADAGCGVAFFKVGPVVAVVVVLLSMFPVVAFCVPADAARAPTVSGPDRMNLPTSGTEVGPPLAEASASSLPHPRRPPSTAAGAVLYVVVLLCFGSLYLFLRNRRGPR